VPDKETGKPSRSSRAPTTPEDFPVTSQSAYPSGDYSYTVELVGTIQHQLGKLTEAVESLKEKTNHHGDKIEQIGKDIHGAKVALYVVGIIVAGAVAFLGWAITTLLPYIAKAPTK
jgi:hypothetical protein